MEVRGECYLCRVDREAGGPFVIEVVQGKVVKATYSDDGSPVPTSVELPTAKDLFARIREGPRGWRWSAKAKYDEHLGYPIVGYNDITDLGYAYVVEDLQVNT